MKNKLEYLTKMSLNRKIKSKWFLAANILLALLIVIVFNIDSVITFFGGDFNEKTKVYVIDQIGDSNEDLNWIDEICMKQAIKKLGNREKTILALRFLKGKTQNEVAKIIGISQAQVSRLEKNAIDKIKNK